MKKYIIILIILLTGTFVFASGSKEDGPKRISIGTAGTAGALYPMGVGMSETITKHVQGISSTGEATAASVENVRNLTNGKLAMGISQSDIAYLAYNGMGDFEKRAAKDLRSLFSTVYSYVQIFTTPNSGINKIEDFKGRVIGCSAAGSGGEMSSRMLLDYYGLSYDDIKPQFIPETEAVAALKDGRIDAFICTHPLKSAALIDLTTSINVKMISLDDPKLYEKFFFWSKYNIPKGTYNNVDEVITVPINRVTMLTSTKANLSDDEVYEIVKVIWENRLEWANVAKSVSSQVLLETALNEISIPLHVGAIRYYKEKGMDIPAELYPPEYK